jgi:hypothetical protein
MPSIRYLSEIRAEQHIQDLLAEAERDRRHRDSRDHRRRWRLTPHPSFPARSASADRHRRTPRAAARMATCGNSTTSGGDRPPLVKLR